MTTPGNGPQDDVGVGPLGSTVSEPDRPRSGDHPEPAEGGEDGMAGPVYPPPETEPDAQG